MEGSLARHCQLHTGGGTLRHIDCDSAIQSLTKIMLTKLNIQSPLRTHFNSSFNEILPLNLLSQWKITSTQYVSTDEIIFKEIQKEK